MKRATLLLAMIAGATASAGLQAQALFINDADVHRMDLSPVLQQADILVQDGRIVSVGVDLAKPEDAIVIEAAGRPVTPGLFAGITALGLEEFELESTTVDHGLRWDKMRPEFDVSLAYNPNSASVPVTRIEGYSWTLLGASSSGSIIAGLGRAVSLDGGYESFLSRPVLFVGLGAASSGVSGMSRAAQFMLLQQALEESRSAMTWTQDALLTAAGRRALSEAVSSGPVVFHADRASDIVRVLQFAEREGLLAVISGGAEAWMVADRLAETGVPVLLDPLLNLPGNMDQVGARLENAALLNEAGVTIAFTADGMAPHNVRKLRHAAGVAVAHGLPYETGLAALTVSPAAIFRLPDGHGTLTPGAPADIVIWTGDPLEVTSLAEQVILNGEVVPMVSRQTLLRDRYLSRQPELPRAYLRP